MNVEQLRESIKSGRVLEALASVLAAKAESSSDDYEELASEFVLALVRFRKDEHVGVLVAKDMLKNEPIQGSQSLLVIALRAAGRISEAEEINQTLKPVPARVQDLANRVAQGGTMTESERAEIVRLLSGSLEKSSNQ